jgi:hypothetical protein
LPAKKVISLSASETLTPPKADSLAETGTFKKSNDVFPPICAKEVTVTKYNSKNMILCTGLSGNNAEKVF